MTGRNSRRNIFLVAGIAAAFLIVAIVVWRHGRSQAAHVAPPSIPVTVTEATQRDVPIYYDALGTVTAYNTVAIRAQVTGQIVSVNFVQGQEVHQGRRPGPDRSGAVQGDARPEPWRRKARMRRSWSMRKRIWRVLPRWREKTSRPSRMSICNRPRSIISRRRSIPTRPPSRRRRSSSITPPSPRRSTASSASVRSMSATSSTPTTPIRSRC